MKTGTGLLLLLVGLAVGAAGCVRGTVEERTAASPEEDLGLETIEDPLPVYRGLTVRLPGPGDELPPLSAWLSRSRYWQQDGHLDVIVRLHPPAETLLEDTRLTLRLKDAAGAERLRLDLDRLPGPQFVFHPRLPDGWLGDGEAELTWRQGERVLAETRLPFRIEVFEEPAPRSGRIPLRIPNTSGARGVRMPATVGVPFPRGALCDTAHLRLVDANGAEIPLQVLETGRWSRFGPLRWVLCDFSFRPDGGPVDLYLEYGPGVRRREGEPLRAETGAGFPVVEAGRLRIDGGVWFDARGDGRYVKVLGEEALHGARITREDGRVYRPPVEDRYTIEEQGPEKLVLRREGWYRPEDSGDGFCLYDIRYVLHRDVPLVRVFHTWVFTGDGSRDRIAQMGWKLPLAEGLRPGGFLDAFGEEGRWREGDTLLQHDYRHFEVAGGGVVRDVPGGRAPGVARAQGQGIRLYFGARDFWQNYPSELEFADGALWFHAWPRHGKPRPDPVVDPETAILLKFVHTGEVLDFRLPRAYTEDPLDQRHSRGRAGSTSWRTGEPDSVNAQGMARTEEFWLYLAPEDADASAAVRVLEGLQAETLRPVVDTHWVAQSGAFYETWPQDWENHSAFERRYEDLVGHYRMNLAEQVGLYGMWLYGEHLLRWDTSQLYRQLRKGHGGYGELSWMPYARSGDPRIFQRRMASTRRMIDANFCHYASEDVARTATGLGHIDRRAGGFWARGPLPWAGRSLRWLDYETQPHQWWDAWYLAGWRRALDFARMWSERVKPEVSPRSGERFFVRQAETALKASVDTYQNLFDPWFIVYAHKLAALHRDTWAENRWMPYGWFWSPGNREYHRFTGCEDHARFYVDLIDNGEVGGLPAVYAWHITGEEEYLRRGKGLLDQFIESGRGAGQGGTSDRASDLPMALGALAAAGPEADDLPGLYGGFWQRRRAYEQDADGVYVFQTPSVALYKQAGEPLRLSFRLIRLQDYNQRDRRFYRVTGPDGEEVLSGDMSDIDMRQFRPGREVEIPAEAAAGIYRVHYEIRSTATDSPGGLRNLRGLRMPLSADPGVPEVIELEEERMGPASVGPSFGTPAYFFMVPEDVDEFKVTGVFSRTGPLLYNPDGEIVWRHPGVNDGPDGGTGDAHITVPPEHRGRLWRIVGADFTMDPRIPPYYAVDPDRWFHPDG